jgi:hypothetical protein
MKFQPVNADNYAPLKLDVNKARLLGDPELHSSFKQRLNASHEAVGKLTAYVDALTADKTGMSAAQGHSFALKAVKQATAVIKRTRDDLHGEVTSLVDDAANEIRTYFSGKLPRTAVELATIQYVREVASDPNKVQQLPELMIGDPTIAAVVHETPGRLLGLAPTVHDAMKSTAVRHHVPEAQARIERAKVLAELVAGHDEVRRTLETSVANPTMAQQHDNRPAEPAIA